ncbi:conserved hypothetical protein [Frankia canadensis]|uniref:Adhesin domain-containing protein n=1 Tax=Frankia canadensis TaxID=1836972 RepID=A0A2I2KVU9_9ACTN|nr:hypothetical protein [Frankia canadensis]SNQ49784.1 conserved hypothetical protein [Frankia canadensis]SOU57074.1 conserved hypothetical protein [Frankia canadensis]
MFDTAVVVVAAVLLVAALGGLSLLRLPPAELVHTVDGIDAVEVMVAAGRVEAAERDRADVRVELTVRRRPGRASPRVTVADGRLRVDGRRSEVRVQLAVPPGTRLRAEVLSGEITLWGFGGELSLVTRDGTIAGRELGAGPVAARSHGGDVTLHFAAPPDAVHARSDTGLVTVMLPDAEYGVQTEAGDPRGVDLELTPVPGAARQIVTRTVSGRVRVGLTAPLGPLPI